MAEFVLKNNLFEFNSKFTKTNIRDAGRYKACSTVCENFYGLHGNRVFKISPDKTLALQKIHR